MNPDGSTNNEAIAEVEGVFTQATSRPCVLKIRSKKEFYLDEERINNVRGSIFQFELLTIIC
jgi:hypothetical protein